jgi:hypothetical protein
LVLFGIIGKLAAVFIAVVGFITTYAISVFHNKHEFETSSDDVHSRQHYVKKFLSDFGRSVVSSGYS